MASIIPISQQFDQQTISKIIAADALLQRYHRLFALLDWSPLDGLASPGGPGRPAHPKSAFAKAFLVRVCEKQASMPALRAFLLFFSSRRRHTRFDCDWSSDVCSSD